MIARVYYLVGAVTVEVGMSAYAFPLRVFSHEEEAGALREYERLAKRNYSEGYNYQEAYMVRVLGEDRTIVKGNEEKLIGYI